MVIGKNKKDDPLMPRSSFAKRYLDAWNSHDPEQVLSFFSGHVTYTDSGLNEQVYGEDVGGYVEKIIALCPDIYFELLDGGAVGEGRAAIQWRAHGEDLASLCPSILTPHIATSGQQKITSLCGLDYVKLDRGRVLSTHVYFDLQEFIEPVKDQDAGAFVGHRQYAKSGLSEQELAVSRQRLQALMQEQQLYLQADLTLAQVAVALDLSTNHLSQVINSQFGLNFNQLLNHFRVEQARYMLAHENTSTLDIAFACGFGSVSAFYRAFQQQVGMSPAQYRKLS